MKIGFKNKEMRLGSNLLFFLVIVVAVNLLLSLFFRYIRFEEVNELKKRQEITTEITDFFVTDSFKDVYESVMVLRDTAEIQNFIEKKGATPVHDIEKLFYRYAETHESLTQIRLICPNGFELARINRKGDVITVVDEEALQDKSERNYFITALALTPDQMYISDFNLNIENGQIVEPFEPTIRFSVKVYNQSGDFSGMLVLNYDGVDFLSVIQELEKTGVSSIEIGLLDLNNYWSLTRLNDSAYIKLNMESGTSGVMRHILDEALEKSLENEAFGYFESEGAYYYYRRLDESHNENYIFEGDGYRWYFISAFQLKKDIVHGHPILDNKGGIRVALSFIALVLAVGFAEFMKKRAAKNLMLLTSTYISNNTHDGIVIVNDRKEVVFSNRVFEDIFGYDNLTRSKQDIRELFDGKIDTNEETGLQDTLWEGNVWNRSKSGYLICKHLLIKAVRDKKNRVVYYIGIYSNPVETIAPRYVLDSIKQLSDSEMTIVSRGVDDAVASENYFVVAVQLTGKLKHVLGASQSLQGKFVDVCVNEVVTDPVLKIIAMPQPDLLLLASPYSDTYIKQDEGHLYEMSLTERIVKEIDYLLKKAVILMSLTSIDLEYISGLAFKMTGDTSKTVVENSMIALEALEKLHTSKYLIYEPRHKQFVRELNLIRGKLKHAFLDNEFYVLYQPQIDFETDEVFGVEALVRWRNKDIGDVPPGRFVSVLEETDDILKLGKFVVKRVLTDFSKMALTKPLRLSINLSGKEFVNDEVVEYLMRLIVENPIENISYCFEITETTLVRNLEIANGVIARLKDAGIEIAIDDFGTGYSSLGYLKALNADEFKIDRMFIKDYPDEDDGKILKAITRMVSEIGVSIIVEGIETEAQYGFVKALGCQGYQGYYRSKPLEFETFKDMLEGGG